MSTTTSQFNTEALGEWGEERRFTVEAERTIAYAEATNDGNPLFVSGEVAPPVFAIVPVWESLGPATFEVVPGELLMRVVHGEQDITFHQPIRPGMELISRAAPVGIHSASSGVTLVVKAETRTIEGEPVNDQWMTSFFRGVEEDISIGEKAPSHRIDHDGDPAAVVTQAFDADQTFRYSEASGDPMPIHLDNDFAVAMGLPGIIIHGLCTMAFNSRAVLGELCDGDPQRLRRLAVRFSRVCRPEQTLETRIWSVGEVAESDGVATYAFESVNSDGDVAIKDGLAEVTG